MQSKHTGFTIMEALITIAIVGIIVALAIPSLGGLSSHDRAAGYLEQVKRGVQFARSKAQATGDVVILCPLTNPSSSGNCQTDWQANEIAIFVDDNNSGSFETASDTLLRVIDKAKSQDLVGFSNNATLNMIRFNGRERFNTATALVLEYCPNKGEDDTQYQMTVTLAGTALYTGAVSQACNL